MNSKFRMRSCSQYIIERMWVLVVVSMIFITTASARPCLLPGAVPLPIWTGPSDPNPACASGFYCPNLDMNNATTWPVIWPPTPACALDRLGLEWCEPQGEFEPTICSAGSYCPPPGKEKFKCPKDYFCPLGSPAPLPCPWLNSCPAGSKSYRQYGTLLVLLFVDGLLANVCWLYYLRRKNKHEAHFNILSETRLANLPRVDLEVPVPTSTQVLIEGFNLSRGNQPLLDFEFKELGLSIPGGKKILQGVTGRIEHGQVTAIMGPSGAGKTTFLNTLMGKVERSWKTEGSLMVNGIEAKGLSKLKKLVGYVPQEDIMHRELSVWQNLQYSADIRLPRDWDPDQRNKHVNAVLEALDLIQVRNSPIGDESNRGVSGGQRKRVNIGMELAACPLALFCDEPTSGLDAAASLSVVTAVQNVARTTGMTVVMVIHQPRVEIWNNLDRLLVLAPGGITTYLGEQRFAQPYFEQQLGVVFSKVDNPADTIMDQVAHHGAEYAKIWEETGLMWYEEYVMTHGSEPSDTIPVSLGPSSSDRKGNGSLGNNTEQVEMEVIEGSTKVTLPPKADFTHDRLNANDRVVRGSSFFMQMWLSFVRSLKQQYMLLPSLALEMILAVLAGAIIGFSARMHFTGVANAPYTMLSPSPESTLVPQKSLYISMSVGIAAASAGVKIFGEERVIFWRESASGHNRLAYYLGVSFAVLPRIILGGLHFSSFFQFISAGYAPFGQFFLNCCLLFYAVYGLAAVVSMIVPRQDAPLLAAVICIIASVLNGYVRSIPVGIDYVSYAYWSNDAYFTGETQLVEKVFNVSIQADAFHYVPHRLPMDFGMMFSIGTIYRIIGFLLLAFLNRDKQL